MNGVDLISVDPSMGVYTAAEAFLMGYLGVMIGVGIAVFIIAVLANWRIFQKAGQPGWACIIPFYGSYVEYKITWGNGWLFLVPIVGGILACCTGVVGMIIGVALLVFDALSAYKLSEAFGHKIAFAIGLYFLPLIFNMILAFNKDEYLGVPIDGTSYRELKNKADDIKANEKPIEYEKPEKED